MTRSNRARRFDAGRELTAAREGLERRWREHLTPEPRLATLVTAQGNAREPFHRWLPYRQGFSPGLVRLYLTEERRELGDGPVLDPFSGSGTTITECARQRRPAIGVEALPALVFVAAAKFEPAWIRLPETGPTESWEQIADQLTLPLHRAALMIAHARRHTGSGALNRAAPTIRTALASVAEMMAEDMQVPLPMRNRSLNGDARELEGIEDECIAGMVTSPPYLSRYDYTQTNDPIETVYRHWFAPQEPAALQQIHASPRGRSRRPRHDALHPAATEAQGVLAGGGHQRQADAVTNYFADMQAVFAAAHRVLMPGAAAWFIVGGVRLKEVYVPTDLVLAEMAQETGFAVEALRVARDLNPIRKKLGGAGHIAPRETLIALRKI